MCRHFIKADYEEFKGLERKAEVEKVRARYFPPCRLQTPEGRFDGDTGAEGVLLVGENPFAVERCVGALQRCRAEREAREAKARVKAVLNRRKRGME